MEQPGTEIAIRLLSHQGAYMVAHDDKATVGEGGDGSSPNAKWVVERVQGKPKVIRLKSCFGLFLTASDGKVDWEPICDDGVHVKLKSCGDKLLQSDGAAQNWTVSFMRWVGELLEGCCEPCQNWVFWDVEDDESSSSASEADFEDENKPLLQLNPTDTRALFQASHDSAQVRSDGQGHRASQVSYGSGQRNSPVKSVSKRSSAYRSHDSGQPNSPPGRGR